MTVPASRSAGDLVEFALVGDAPHERSVWRTSRKVHVWRELFDRVGAPIRVLAMIEQ
jgi:hypothetical protein